MPATIKTANVEVSSWYSDAEKTPGVCWIKDAGYFWGWDRLGLWFQNWATDAVHHVTVRAGQAGVCSCPDAKYRKRDCKHVNAARDVLAAW